MFLPEKGRNNAIEIGKNPKNAGEQNWTGNAAFVKILKLFIARPKSNIPFHVNIHYKFLNKYYL